MVVPGMTAPDFRAPTNKGHTLAPEAFADRLAVVLVFLDPLDTPSGASVFWAFDTLLPEFGARRVQLLGVAPTTPRTLRDQTDDGSLTLLADEDGTIRAAFGVDATAPATVVIDRHGTVAAVLTDDDSVRPPAVLEVVDQLLVEQPEAVEAHPSGPSDGDAPPGDPGEPR
jgi:peroxiredoxin